MYKLIEGMPHASTRNNVRKRLCQVFSPVLTMMDAATRIHSRPQSSNETLQEYIQRFTDLVIQVQVLILLLPHVNDYCHIHLASL